MNPFEEPIELMGAPGSPYTRKMLALLRYKRVNYRLLPGIRNRLNPEPERYRERPEPKVRLLPTFYGTTEEGSEFAICDSTPIIREIDSKFAKRSVIPANPVLSLLNSILEDFADEWLTKAMFHYRWSYEPDIKKAGDMLPRWNNTTASDELIAEKSREISAHQIGRLKYVGSNAITQNTIESSFERFLEKLDKVLSSKQFILGNRPSSCDFAVYGQLTCLALFDPTPQRLIIEKVPRIYAWTEVMEDLSGYELLKDDWLSIEEEGLPDSLAELLSEIGDVYAPYMLANEESVKLGDGMLRAQIGGRDWEQTPFPYHAKCLKKLRDEYSELDEENRILFRGLADKTKLTSLFDAG
tara:strand:+ start:968 stop:2032 length:1065 start_codon:yes stop_codon:yes gene_type:complete